MPARKLNLIFSWFVAFIALCCINLAPQSVCEAQTTNLINSQAAAKANSSQRARLPVKTSSTRHVASELQPESVDALLERRKYEKFFADYRGFSFLNEQLGFSDANDIEEQDKLAQSVLIYHSGKTLSNYILKSPLSELYRSFARKVKSFRDVTTVQVGQDSGGELSFGGANTKKAEELLKFKLHMSPRKGVEPQITIGEHMNVHYDVFEEQTMFEIFLDF